MNVYVRISADVNLRRKGRHAEAWMDRRTDDGRMNEGANERAAFYYSGVFLDSAWKGGRSGDRMNGRPAERANERKHEETNDRTNNPCSGVCRIVVFGLDRRTDEWSERAIERLVFWGLSGVCRIWLGRAHGRASGRNGRVNCLAI